MNLNLGCADRYVHGWTNVDLPSCPHPADERVDLAGPLPWPPHSITSCFAGHLLEHMHWGQCRHLLAALRPLMTPGGRLCVVGPDIAVAEQMEAAGQTLEVPLGAIRSGSRRWEGDEHRWDATPRAVVRLLELTGWQQISQPTWDELDGLWPVAERGPRWQYAVTAQAPHPNEEKTS